MVRNYVNPSQFLTNLDDQTFKNIESKHQEYYDEYLKASLEDEKYLDTFITVEYDFGDFYSKNGEYEFSIIYYFKSLDNIKKRLVTAINDQTNYEKYINLLEFVKKKLSDSYHQLKRFDDELNLHLDYYHFYLDHLPNTQIYLQLVLGVEELNIGRLYFDLNKYQESEDYLLKALDKFPNRDVKTTEFIIMIKLYLSRIYGHTNRIDQAIKTYEEIISWLAKTIQDNNSHHKRIIDVKNEYAKYLLSIERYDESISILLENLSLMDQDKNRKLSQNKFYAQTLLDISHIYEIKKEYAKAIEYAKKAYEMYEQLAGIDNNINSLLPDIRNNIATYALRIEEYKLAEEEYLKNIEFIISQESKLTTHQKDYLARQYLMLSTIKDKQKDNDNAYKYWCEVYRIYQELYNEDQEKFIKLYLDASNTMANFYYSKKEYNKASSLSLELLEIVEDNNSLVDKHFKIMNHERLIKIYRINDQIDEAIYHYECLISLYQDLNKNNSHLHKLLDVYSQLGEYYHQRKDFSQALFFMSQASIDVMKANLEKRSEEELLVPFLLRLVYWKREGEIKEGLENNYQQLIDVLKHLVALKEEKYYILLLDIVDKYADLLLLNRRVLEATNLLQENCHYAHQFALANDEFRCKEAIAHTRLGRCYILNQDYGSGKNEYLIGLNILNSLNDKEKYRSLIEQINNVLNSIEKRLKVN